MESPSQLQTRCHKSLLASGLPTPTFAKKLGVQHNILKKVLRGEKISYPTQMKIRKGLKEFSDSEKAVEIEQFASFLDTAAKVCPDDINMEYVNKKIDELVHPEKADLDVLRDRLKAVLKSRNGPTSGISAWEFAKRAGLTEGQIRNFKSGIIEGLTDHGRLVISKIEAELDRMDGKPSEDFRGSFGLEAQEQEDAIDLIIKGDEEIPGELWDRLDEPTIRFSDIDRVDLIYCIRHAHLTHARQNELLKLLFPDLSL